MKLAFSMSEIATGLECKDAIYIPANSSQHHISFPETGHDTLWQLEQVSFWYQHRNRCITSFAKEYCQDQSFLDLGGGNGYVSKALQEAGINAVLLEPDMKGCLNARSRGVNNIIYSDLQNANLKKASMGAVGLFDVLEHIEDERKFLADIYPILSDSAYLFITVPAYEFLWSAEDEYMGHQRRYTCDQLAKLLSSSSYKIVYLTYYFQALILPIFLFRSLPSMLGIRKASVEMNVNEHKEKPGLVGKAIDYLLEREFKDMQKHRVLPFGASCFVIAQKL
jgi:SAM-dependent methyltransferase